MHHTQKGGGLDLACQLLAPRDEWQPLFSLINGQCYPHFPPWAFPFLQLAMTCKPALTTRSVNQDRILFDLPVHFTLNKRCSSVHFVPVIVRQDKPLVFNSWSHIFPPRSWGQCASSMNCKHILFLMGPQNEEGEAARETTRIWSRHSWMMLCPWFLLSTFHVFRGAPCSP